VRALPALGAALLLAGCAGLTQDPKRILAEGAQWSEVSRAGLFTAEGVVADRGGFLYVSDITRPDDIKENNPGGTIYRVDPRTGAATKLMEPSGMANGLHVDRNGDLLIAQESEMNGGRAIVRRNLATGAVTLVANAYQGRRLNSPNDLTSDARGRVYFTDARYFGDEPIELPNAVYRVDPDGRIVQLSTDIYRPNGIEVSPDGRRLYVAASNLPFRLVKNPLGPAKDRFGLKLGGVVAYDLDANGDISNGRVFYRSDHLITDGMAMDTDGNLYVAAHNGAREPPQSEIVVLDSLGNTLTIIQAPEGYRLGNVGFGRGRDAASLYATTLFKWRLFRIQTVRRGHYFE
jgi:gluconolactonase